jgi:hypothetical protein
MAIKSFTRSTIENNIFYRSMLAGNDAFDPSSENILAEEVLTSSQASVTFSSLDTLAAGYQHLQIRMTARSTRNATSSDFDFRFNGDSGTNYTWHYMRGSGSAMESAGTGGLDSVRGYQTLTGATNTSGSFAATVIDILDPFETTKNTTIRFFTGFTGSLNRVLLESGVWLNTDAVTSITLDEYYGSNFAAGSRFTLIGLK